MHIAFDVDDTLYKCTYPEKNVLELPKLVQVPDYDLIQVLRWFHQNGDTLYVWSGAGAFSLNTNLSPKIRATFISSTEVCGDLARRVKATCTL